MSTTRMMLCAFCCLALAAGCSSSGPLPPWPELDTEDAPDANVRPPSWYKPAKDHAPWPLEPEPEYGTHEWRNWCSLRYNSRDIVRPIEIPPEIDGKLEDAWQGTALHAPFVGADGKAASPATTVYIAYDKDNLYIAARVAEPNPDKLQAAAQRRDGAVQFDDHMEIQLAPGWRANEFPTYWILVNSKGVFGDGIEGQVAFNLDLKAAAAVEQEAWTVELAVPLEGLRGAADELWGQVWACRFFRFRYAGGGAELSSWTRIIDASKGTSNWGHVIFKGVKPKPTEPKEEAPTPPAKGADSEKAGKNDDT